MATGNLSKWVEGLPWIGQAATDLERTLDAIKSNIGFNKLEDLKGLRSEERRVGKECRL